MRFGCRRAGLMCSSGVNWGLVQDLSRGPMVLWSFGQIWSGHARARESGTFGDSWDATEIGHGGRDNPMRDSPRVGPNGIVPTAVPDRAFGRVLGSSKTGSGLFSLLSGVPLAGFRPVRAGSSAAVRRVARPLSKLPARTGHAVGRYGGFGLESAGEHGSFRDRRDATEIHILADGHATPRTEARAAHTGQRPLPPSRKLSARYCAPFCSASRRSRMMRR